jgi:ribosomal protein S18 acetylase RimI-like enzyme
LNVVHEREQMIQDPSEPVRLVASQQEQAVEALTGAFCEDPMYAYVFPDVDERVRSMRWLWSAVLKYGLLYGVTYTIPAVAGVACWLPPGKTEVTLWRTLRAGLPLAVMRFRRSAQRRCMDVINYMDGLHKQTMTRPHWYLWVLGVDPAHQGQGIGSSLLRPVLAQADEDGVPCYLETQTEWNVAFYRRRGFEVLGESLVPGHGLEFWTMAREPRQ